MEPIEFIRLRRLQAFIFVHDVESETRELDRFGFHGIPLALKLNSKAMMPFSWPIPDDAPHVNVDEKTAQLLVIPIKLSFDIGTLMAAVAKAGKGWLLLSE